jgi:integrase
MGRPEHPERYSERFRGLGAEAGLPAIRLHALRHSMAAWLDGIGVARSAGAAWLGHTVAIYQGTYFPERGAGGIAEAAEVMVRASA